VSGGVETKEEIVSDDEMSRLSEYPSEDLPNQEKNYTELFIDRNKGLFTQKGDKDTDQ